MYKWRLFEKLLRVLNLDDFVLQFKKANLPHFNSMYVYVLSDYLILILVFFKFVLCRTDVLDKKPLVLTRLINSL